MGRMLCPFHHCFHRIEEQSTSVAESNRHNQQLRNHIQSSILPSTIQPLLTVMREKSLSTFLKEGQRDYLDYEIENQPYKLRRLSIGINVEDLVYFLIDFKVARSFWDPYFLYADDVEQLNKNSAIIRIVQKPVEWASYPCLLKASPRDYCVYFHFNYDEQDGIYYILLVSTNHRRCPPSDGFIRGEMGMIMIIIEELRN